MPAKCCPISATRRSTALSRLLRIGGFAITVSMAESGQEQTLDSYIEEMAAVSRKLWRVLKPSGTFWLNLGDTYNARPVQRKATDKPSAEPATNGGSIGVPSISTLGPKRKDLCLVPERVAMRYMPTAGICVLK